MFLCITLCLCAYEFDYDWIRVGILVAGLLAHDVLRACLSPRMHIELTCPHACISSLLALTHAYQAYLPSRMHIELTCPHACISSLLALTHAYQAYLPSRMHIKITCPHACIDKLLAFVCDESNSLAIPRYTSIPRYTLTSLW